MAAPGGIHRETETELLLCCARTCLEPEMAERIQVLLQRGIDWAYFISTASMLGIKPLLYFHLKNLPAEAVSPAALDQLRRHACASALNNSLLTKELLRLLTLLKTHGVRALPYKGPALAASVYGDLSLRQFGDLDILIHKRDILKARNVLISDGYRPGKLPWWYVRTVDEERFREERTAEFEWEASTVGVEFFRVDGRIQVDLQWEITPKFLSFTLSDDWLWERLVPGELCGSPILSLSPEDWLIVLCVHGSKHRWQKLVWLCDIAELIRINREINWQNVMEQATTLGAKRLVGLGLILAHDLLATTLPVPVMQWIQADLTIQSLAAQVREWLFAGSPPKSQNKAFMFNLRERLRDRVRFRLYPFLAVMTPNSKDRALASVPESLAFVYYILRPIRLTSHYGLRGARHLMKRFAGI